MNLKLKLIPLLFVPLLAVGCGGDGISRLKTHPVEGLVQFEGRPLEGAFVVLHPKGVSDPKHLAAQAKTDATGKFKPTTYDVTLYSPAMAPSINSSATAEPIPRPPSRSMCSPASRQRETYSLSPVLGGVGWGVGRCACERKRANAF